MHAIYGLHRIVLCGGLTALDTRPFHCATCSAVQCAPLIHPDVHSLPGHRLYVSCCRRLLANLLTSLLSCNRRATWLLLLLVRAEALP